MRTLLGKWEDTGYQGRGVQKEEKIKANFKKLRFALQIISIFLSLIYNIYIAFVVQLVLINLNLALFKTMYTFPFYFFP